MLLEPDKDLRNRNAIINLLLKKERQFGQITDMRRREKQRMDMCLFSAFLETFSRLHFGIISSLFVATGKTRRYTP